MGGSIDFGPVYPIKSRSSSGTASAMDEDVYNMGPNAQMGQVGYGNPKTSRHTLSFSGTGMDEDGVWGSPAMTLTSSFEVESAHRIYENGSFPLHLFQKARVTAVIRFDKDGIPLSTSHTVESGNYSYSYGTSRDSNLSPSSDGSGRTYGIWRLPVTLNNTLWEFSGTQFRYYGGPWQRLIKISGP